MTREDMDILVGQLLDDSLELEFEEFCRMCHASEEFVVDLVAEGVLEPRGAGRAQWRFTGLSVRRTQVAMRLVEDLDVNLPGVALVLDLLEDVERLR